MPWPRTAGTDASDPQASTRRRAARVGSGQVELERLGPALVVHHRDAAPMPLDDPATHGQAHAGAGGVPRTRSPALEDLEDQLTLLDR